MPFATSRALLFAALLSASLCAHALRGAAPAEVTLQGHWSVNIAQSDDGEAMLARRREQQMKELQRDAERRRRRMQNDPLAWEPELAPPERTPQNMAAMEDRERRTRQMLGLTKRLDIVQDERGAQLTIASEFETRRLDAGSRSHVSLPQGQLAEAECGWHGDAFVIERKARDGPRIVERYRRLEKTDQLEVVVAIGGESMLAGMKLRRVFDRAAAEVPAKPVEMGPVR